MSGIKREDNLLEYGYKPDYDNKYDFKVTSKASLRDVEGVLKRIESEYFVLPEIQRNFVWNKKKASLLIDSLYRGIPIPSIIVSAVVKKKNSFYIIDGQQRMTSMFLFIKKKKWTDGKVFKLLGEEIHPDISGKSFDEFTTLQQQKILDTDLFTVFAEQESPQNEIHHMFELFKRINGEPTRLSNQQVRMATYFGKFSRELSSFSSHLGKLLKTKIEKASEMEEWVLNMLFFYNKDVTLIKENTINEKHSLNKLMKTWAVKFAENELASKQEWTHFTNLILNIFDNFANIAFTLRTKKPTENHLQQRSINPLKSISGAFVNVISNNPNLTLISQKDFKNKIEKLALEEDALLIKLFKDKTTKKIRIIARMEFIKNIISNNDFNIEEWKQKNINL